MDASEVEKIASLARLTLNESEKAKFSQQLSAVLDSFQAIAKVDTHNVEPLVTPSEIELNLRADESVQWANRERALANAPEKSGHLFRVPPVV